MNKKTTNKYYKVGIKNLQKQINLCEKLLVNCNEFGKWQFGSVIKSSTFHLLVSINNLKDGIPNLIKDLKKGQNELKRKLK